MSVGDVFYDVWRMAEVVSFRPLVSLHGEYASVGSGQCLERAAEVCAVGCCSEVVYHVLDGHDGKAVGEEHVRPEDGFVEGFSLFSVLAAHGQDVVAIAAFADEVFELSDGGWVVEPGVVFVPLVDDSAPRCPAPDAEVCGEEVVAFGVGGLFVDVEAAYHCDALVVFVAVEHFFAEGEETDGRHIVVFEHDAFVDMAEGPFLRDVLRGVAAVVFLLEEGLHVALPVHLCHHFPTGKYAWHVGLGAWSVLIEEESRRACFAHLVEDLAELLWPVEEQD